MLTTVARLIGRPNEYRRCWVSLILAFVLPTQSIAQSGWPHEVGFGAFYYHADFPIHNLRPYFQEVARLQTEVPGTLGIEPSAASTNVYLFKRKTTYRRYLKRYFPGVSQRRAMFIRQNDLAMVFACNGDQMLKDLRHEGTHAVLHGCLSMVPLWLDEGIAEYFEVAPRNRFAHHEHLKSVMKQVARGNVPSLPELESLNDFSKMTTQDYRDAWAWTHFLLHGPTAARRTLTNFLRDIQRQSPPGRLSERLTRILPDADRRFRHHFAVLSTSQRETLRR